MNVDFSKTFLQGLSDIFPMTFGAIKMDFCKYFFKNYQSNKLGSVKNISSRTIRYFSRIIKAINLDFFKNIYINLDFLKIKFLQGPSYIFPKTSRAINLDFFPNISTRIIRYFYISIKSYQSKKRRFFKKYFSEDYKVSFQGL